MKILYDCFSCSPYYGSDEGIGWMWPYLMSKYHEVWALVRTDRKKDIDKFCSEHEVANLHFVYCDIPEWLNIYYHRHGAMRFLIYQYMWRYAAIKAAKKLHKQVGFDLVHHVSTNDFRLLGFMYKLKIPFIIGPIGGAQETPDVLFDYIEGHKKSEKLRTLINKVLTSMPSYRKALKKATKIYVSNDETAEFIKKKCKDHTKIEQLTEVAFQEENIADSPIKPLHKETIFMWAGRIEYRKGLELLFDVLKKLPLDKQWKVYLCGNGTEKDKYIERVKNESYSDRVIFTGKLPYEEVQELYNTADCFVFPSLRETTGTVIIEAMAHGVPVICLNQGGGKYVVNDECGWLIEGATKEEYINNFANAMKVCIDTPEVAQEKGQVARQRVIEKYTWEKKVADMNGYYSTIIKNEN